ncbi:hypothetical protein D9M68_970220 [compost metagenome]
MVCTSLPAATLPLNSGLLSLVTPPWEMVPVIGSISSTRSSHSGFAGSQGSSGSGALASIVKFQSAVLSPSLPAASTGAARKLCAPSARSGETKLQVPSALTTALPSKVSPS